MIIQRPLYLTELINRRHNHMVKIITGLRRCGKSFLLFDIFSNYLTGEGIKGNHIIKVDFEDRRNRDLKNPDNLMDFIDSKIVDNQMHYLLIDEIQEVKDYTEVLLSYIKRHNIDIYVTGSNAKLLSKDVITSFRGRGDEIKMYPLSFKEFYSAVDIGKDKALDDFMLYGGLPQTVEMPTDRQKVKYLDNLFTQTYIKDIKERYNIRNDEELEILLDIIASDIGSPTNPTRLQNTFLSTRKIKISDKTIKSYLDYISDAFLISKAKRFDVKGRKYIDSPSKYYFTDLGLRNARLNFRQTEPAHLMENLIYNELLIMGFNVDVGVVPAFITDKNGEKKRAQFEIDFVCNAGNSKFYIQSAYKMPTEEKIAQEKNSLLRIDDSFKKIIIEFDDINPRKDDRGISTISIYDFLLKENPLEL